MSNVKLKKKKTNKKKFNFKFKTIHELHVKTDPKSLYTINIHQY